MGVSTSKKYRSKSKSFKFFIWEYYTTFGAALVNPSDVGFAIRGNQFAVTKKDAVSNAPQVDNIYQIDVRFSQKFDDDCNCLVYFDKQFAQLTWAKVVEAVKQVNCATIYDVDPNWKDFLGYIWYGKFNVTLVRQGAREWI